MQTCDDSLDQERASCGRIQSVLLNRVCQRNQTAQARLCRHVSSISLLLYCWRSQRHWNVPQLVYVLQTQRPHRQWQNQCNRARIQFLAVCFLLPVRRYLQTNPANSNVPEAVIPARYIRSDAGFWRTPCEKENWKNTQSITLFQWWWLPWLHPLPAIRSIFKGIPFRP